MTYEVWIGLFWLASVLMVMGAGLWHAGSRYKLGYDAGEKDGFSVGYRTGLKIKAARFAASGHEHSWPDEPERLEGKWATYRCECGQLRKVRYGVEP